jgi:small-conductance mechanosensitive channel
MSPINILLDSLYTIIGIIITIVVTLIVARIVNKALTTYFRASSKSLKIDETRYILTRRIVVAMVYIIGVITIISLVPQLKGLTTALIAGAGFTGIVVGFAAQKAFSNIISGIFLVIFRPFRVGDVVEMKGEYGTIEDITLHDTVIRTWENKRLIIPNDVISDEAIINWSITNLMVLWHVDFGISYDSDIDLARATILEEIDKHPNVLHDRPANVLVTELGDFAVNLRALFWVKDRPTAWGVGCDIREFVKKRFDREGIEIPFPYRTIVFKEDNIKG